MEFGVTGLILRIEAVASYSLLKYPYRGNGSKKNAIALNLYDARVSNIYTLLTRDDCI